MTSIKHPTLMINSAGEVAIETKSGPLPAPKQALDQVDLVLSQYEEKKKSIEIPPPPPVEHKVREQPAMVIPATSHSFEPKKEAPTVASTDLPPSDWITIEIKSGDVLEKIAKHHGCSIEELKRVNHLSSPHLYIGQTLYVPKAAQKATQTQTVQNEIHYYVVKAGDNPWTIAMKNQLKVEELLRLNNLDESKAKKLKPGDKLRIK
jgi:LysM repeat protein